MTPILWIVLITGLLLTGFVVPKIIDISSNGVSFKNPFSPTQISITNQTSVNTTSVWDWAKKIPIKDVWNNISGGVLGIARWASDGLNLLFGWIIHFISPHTAIPSWFGILVLVLIIVGLLWFGFESFWEVGHKVVTIAIIAILCIFIVAVFLIILGLIH